MYTLPFSNRFVNTMITRKFALTKVLYNQQKQIVWGVSNRGLRFQITSHYP